MVKITMNTDFGNNHFGISQNFRNYHHYISKLTDQTYTPTPLTLRLKMTNSTDFSKWDLRFKNLFFYNIGSNLWKLHFHLNFTNKKIKYINYDVFPNCKAIFSSDTVPLKFTLKHGQYQASRNQNIVDYDFSKVIQSMLPYNKSGASLQYLFRDNFWLGRDPVYILGRTKVAYNKIHNYEDNIKLSGSVKCIYELQRLTDLFTVQLSNQVNVKKSFLGMLDSRQFTEPHITSGYDFRSKILGFNFLERDSVIDNRIHFMAQNYFEIRLKDLWFLKSRNIAVFEPFVGFETLFVPHYDSTGSKLLYNYSLKFILNTGLSIRLNDALTFDISLYTYAKSTPSIKPDLVNRIRININFSSGLD
jgi:hypothetical protein